MINAENFKEAKATLENALSKELAVYEGLKKDNSANFEFQKVLAKGVLNIKLDEVDNPFVEELNLISARAQIVIASTVLLHQLKDEGVSQWDYFMDVFYFIANTPREEVQYLLRGNYEDCSLSQLMAIV